MIIGISVIVMALTGFLLWVFWKHDFVVAFAVTILVLAIELVVPVVVGSVYLGGSHSCSKVAEKLEVEHDYGFFTGCFIKDENGRWYNYSQQRIVK